MCACDQSVEGIRGAVNLEGLPDDILDAIAHDDAR
jgi:hypothetical protein